VGTFEYTAMNNEGHSVSGSIQTISKASAAELLNKQGFKPLLIKEKKAGFDPNNLQFRFLKSKKVKNKDSVIFTRQLATMINAGVPLVRSLNTLKDQSESKVLKTVLMDVAKDVESGQAFADALDKHKEVFGPIYVNMVKAGEAGGILDDILKRLAFQQEKDASIKKKIRSASAYPTVLLVITVVAFFVLMTWIVPQLGRIIADLSTEGSELPAQTRFLLGLSDFMTKYWYIFLILIGGGIYGGRRYIKTKSGRKNWHSLLLKIPIISTLVTKVAVARFARIFSSLMSAGVSVLESINITAEAIGNDIIEQELKTAGKAVTAGQQLSEPLSTSNIFPPIVAQMLSVGEETGQTDTVLIKVADFYEEEVDALIEGLSSIIEPVMIVLMGGMVGVIGAAVWGPIAGLTQNIG
jgi:type IV pilus assembly protein PilC